MEQIDVLVIGAGVVGLAIARALALAGREVIVADKETAIGQGVSSRNSEVIHAGLYYPGGSLKAQLCVRGKNMLYAYCRERSIALNPCGKLIVATHASQLPKLADLERQAATHGVPVQRLAREEARAREPALECTAALLSPTTGVVDSHGLMTALQGDLEHAGGMVALGSEIRAVQLYAGAHGIHVVESVSNGIQTLMAARTIVNAACLGAPQLARRMQGLDARHIPQAHYAKGSYYALTGRAPFSHLIYPIPDTSSLAGLGVHLTLDLGGQAKFGPDVQWLTGIDDPAHIDYSVDPQRADSFYAQVRQYWPALPEGALQPSYSGVRPKITGEGQAAADFRIDGASVHGVPGLINLFGIESPGLTSALAIGEHVTTVLA